MVEEVESLRTKLDVESLVNGEGLVAGDIERDLTRSTNDSRPCITVEAIRGSGKGSRVEPLGFCLKKSDRTDLVGPDREALNTGRQSRGEGKAALENSETGKAPTA